MWRCFQLKTFKPSPGTNYQGVGKPLDSPRTELTASRAPRTTAESMKSGEQARDKVRNGGGRRECRFLSPSLRRWPIQDRGATPKYWNKTGSVRGNQLVPFQRLGPRDGPRIGRQHRQCISKGFTRTSWNGTRAGDGAGRVCGVFRGLHRACARIRPRCLPG